MVCLFNMFFCRFNLLSFSMFLPLMLLVLFMLLCISPGLFAFHVVGFVRLRFLVSMS